MRKINFYLSSWSTEKSINVASIYEFRYGSFINEG